MYPRLFEIPEIFGIGPLTIYTYGVMLAAAYLAGLQLAIVRGRKARLDPGRLLDLGVYIVIAALVGAKLLLLVVNFNYFRNNPDEILVLARSGGVFYGGLITATLVAFWYIRRHALPFWTTCDMFAPGIALGHVIGRMGCLMAGCCYGRQTNVPWAVTFTDPFAAANVGTPSERTLASHSSVRGGRGAPHPDFSARHREEGPSLPRTARSGATCSSMPSRGSSSNSIAPTSAVS